ncbi:MAG: dTDP-4-dehydrorhamnose reductase [Gallionellaceae bacterium]|nr:dTDP-4-dehydrorhamnose reductase [Gallionellaceae bacterium]
MKILLLGKNGQVGSELHTALAPLGEVIAYDRHDCDLSVPESMREKIRKLQPDVIVNAAAHTAVDKAESEPDLALTINGTAPGILAQEAKKLDALLVHYSTDYVFDGSKRTPYVEQDTPQPLNVYGHTKLAGERAIAAQAARYLIFRTSWVYDAQRKNFLTTIKRLGGQKPELTIVNDQLGAPTWSREIAHTTARIIGLYLSRSDQKNLNGIYHLTAQGQTSWFGFAQAAARCGLFDNIQPPPILRAITSAEFPTPAKRPMYSVMSNAKLLKQFGIQLPDWEVSLQECLKANAAPD